MADKEIDELTAAGALSGSEIVHIVQSSNSRKATLQDIADLGGISLIDEQSPSGTGTVTFTSIPADFRDLKLIVRGRGTTTATTVVVAFTFNNDTGANYDSERMTANAASAPTSAQVLGGNSIDGVICAANATADVADAIEMDIYDYHGTTFQKAALLSYGIKTSTSSGGLTLVKRSGYWRNTAAITEIDVTLAAGNFVAGSVVSLYGRK